MIGQLKWTGGGASCESRAASPSRRRSSAFLLPDRSRRLHSLSDHQVSTDPRFGLFDFAAVEVSDRGSVKWLAKYRHTVFPRLLANQSEALNVPEVFQIELDVLPEGTSSPALEIVHLNQYPQFAMFFDQALNLRHEMVVVLFGEFAGEFDHQNLPASILVQID